MSLRLRLVNAFARQIIRPRLGRTKDPVAARREFDRLTRFLPLPSGVAERQDGAILRLSPKSPSSDKVILYFHGGAYIVGSPKTHRRLGACLAAASGCEVLLPRYRLAPEHPAPAAFDDALAAFRDIARSDSRQVILGGDSAGGGLAFAVLAALGDGDVAPGGIFAFSPWTDLTQKAEDRGPRASTDRLLPLERFEEVCGFLGDACALDDPRLSPAFATFVRPAPALIQVAKTEALHSDAVRLVSALRAAGGDVQVSELPDGPHVWQMLDLVLPEARASLAEVGQFVKAL